MNRGRSPFSVLTGFALCGLVLPVLLGLIGCGDGADEAARGLEILERARHAERRLSYRGVRFERMLYNGGDVRGRVHVHHGPDRSTMEFATTDLPRPAALAAQIVGSSDAVSIWLRGALGADATLERIVGGLNRILFESRRWNGELFAELEDSLDLRGALASAAGPERVKARRHLLAIAYPGLIHNGDAGTREVRTWMNEANEATSRFEAENGKIAWLHTPGLLVTNYRLVPEGTAEIAGRDADAYRIVAPRPQRFSRRIWVDRENGFLLRDLAIDARGRVVEERRYEFIEFGVGAPDAGFGVAREAEEGPALEPISFEGVAERVDFSVCVPQTLPEGFSRTPIDVRWSGTPEGPVVLTYGDGLARVVIRQSAGDGVRTNVGRRTVEVLRRIDGGTTRLTIGGPGPGDIDITSTSLDASLLNGIVASLRALDRPGDES